MSTLQRLICGLFLLLGLAAALYSCLLRVQADAHYKHVAVLVDWHALNSLPEPTDGPPRLTADSLQPLELIKLIPGAVLCYGEETVGTLLEQGLIEPAGLGTGGPAYAVTRPEYSADIAAGASRHGYMYQQDATTGGRLVIEFPALPEEDLMLVPVAWLDGVIARAAAADVAVVLRPGGSEFLGEHGIARTLDYCGGQPLMLFQGPTVLGYPNGLREVAKYLAASKQFFGWVEFDEQDGGASLAARLAPNVVRVHSIPPEEMVNYDVNGAVARYVRAVRERNMRAIYVRPFIRGEVVGSAVEWDYKDSLASVNEGYFKQLATELEDAGFSITLDPQAPANPPAGLAKWLPLLITLAVGAAGTFLFALWFAGWPRWVWWLFIVMTAIKAALTLFEDSLFQLVLFGAAIFFPLLGCWLALNAYQRLVQARPAWHITRLFAALIALMIASALSVAGGLLIHGGLWDSAAMIKVTQFRGVTAGLALPVLLLAAYAWQAETLEDAFDAATRRLIDYWQRFSQLWQAPIRYGDVAFIAIALGALAIVLLRSGNDSPLEILSVESLFRENLEQWFTVRPRTKELFGHPLFVIFLLSLPWRSRIALLFGLAGLLGQVSILNTFCHLHTPLLVTIERVLLGLGLGLASGLLWGALVLLATRIWQGLAARFKRPAPAE
ncbi:hypothetical protein JW859_04315 [bacterium]|nr:hypothetical protein [bacterium]